jgi:hypothetical protein
VVERDGAVRVLGLQAAEVRLTDAPDDLARPGQRRARPGRERVERDPPVGAEVVVAADAPLGLADGRPQAV